MPALPWRSTASSTGDEVVVMATRLDLASYLPIAAFFRASMAIRAQVERSPGALGMSLIAHPLKRQFLTLTAWADDAALRRFVGEAPHRDAMRRFRPKMDHPVFVTWSMPAAAMPPSWDEARDRLEHDPNRIVR